MKWSELFQLLRDAAQAFGEDKAPRLAAALSYHAIFSIAPILFFVVAIVSQFLAADTIKEQLQGFLAQNLNSEASALIIDLIPPEDKLKQSSFIAGIIGFATLFMGATGLFIQLQDALNSIWGVPDDPPAGILPLIVSRLQAFLLILTFGVVILLFLVANTYLSALAKNIGDFLQLGGWGIWLIRLTTFALGTAVLTFMFAAVYKILPNTRLQWRETMIGSLITAILFNLGQIAIGFYLASFSPQGTFGAASSLVLLLLWINFSSMIFFFGAEVTWVYSQRYGQNDGSPLPRRPAAGLLGQLGFTVPAPAPVMMVGSAASLTPPLQTGQSQFVAQQGIKAQVRASRRFRLATPAPIQQWQKRMGEQLEKWPLFPKKAPKAARVTGKPAYAFALPRLRSTLWNLLCVIWSLPVLLVFKLIGWDKSTNRISGSKR